MKTDKYYLEILHAPFIALLAGVLNLVFPNLLSCKDPTLIISKSVDISFILFGFLLTVLALIIQSTKEIKDRNLYSRLIDYNKRIVYLSITLGFYSLLYLSLFDKIILLESKEWFASIYILLFIWIILDTLHFITIFYKLAKDGKI